MIAQEIKENIKFENELMQNIEVVNGYLNFYVMPEKYVLNVLNEIADKQEEYGKSTIGNGKNVVVDYSAPNIAKPFHIGHLRSTVIGNAIYKTHKHLGYNCTGVNHLGDYGTQFGKLIEGYKRWGEEYKVELISELEDGTITTYTQGAFTDLCRGPHVPNTGLIKAVKITSLSGAYWRGDEKRKQLVRVYGITFPKKMLLDEYLV